METLARRSHLLNEHFGKIFLGRVFNLSVEDLKPAVKIEVCWELEDMPWFNGFMSFCCIIPVTQEAAFSCRCKMNYSKYQLASC